MPIWRRMREWDVATDSYGEWFIDVSQIGRVKDVFNGPHQAMSDVYTTATFAECIRDDGSLERVLVNANFECDLSEGKAKIDATDELLELHKAYCAAVIEREKQALEAKFVEQQRQDSLLVGCQVTVTSKHRGTRAGHVGIIAFRHKDCALVKPITQWRDRKANGVWIPLLKLVHCSK